MVRDDFVALRRREPFLPFRVTLTDGRRYDVIHPQLMMAGGRDLFVGIPRNGSDQPIFEHQVWIPYSDIKQVDMLDADKLLKTRDPGLV